MRKPNFIIIHTDQQRADCINAAGRRKGLYTPHLDSIAHQGAMFDSCYATCPVCIPQRLSLLTGQLPQNKGIIDNVGIPYLPLETTFPAEMRKGGYQTALVGRTMHTYPFNHPYGFEYYLPGDPSSEVRDTKDAFFQFLKEEAPKDCGGYDGGGTLINSRVGFPFHLEDRFHQTTWATNRALDFIDSRDPSRPFMLFVGYYAPHSPMNPPAEYYNRYYNREDLDDPYISDWDVAPVDNGGIFSHYVDLKGEELRSTRAGYYGNISFIDSQVGRILNRLVYMPNTYVIFTSDHGEMLGDHHAMHKGRPYEGSIHTPFLVMGPGISGGQMIDKPIGWHDIMPTVLDMASLPVPDSVDGQSIKPFLFGKTPETWREYIHGECIHGFYGNGSKPVDPDKHNFFSETSSQYLTDGKMKYIWYSESGKEQLFNIETDWKEANDLSGDPAYEAELGKWRGRLIKELTGRREEFTDGKVLIPGKSPKRMSEWMEAVYNQRREEGYNITYEIPTHMPFLRDYTNNLMD